MGEGTVKIAKDIAVIKMTIFLFSWSLHLRNQILNTLGNKEVVVSSRKKIKQY